MRRHGLLRQLYAGLVGLLPPDAREYREEIVESFGQLLDEAPSRRGRLLVGLRAFGRLPAVLALEWFEFLGLRRSPGRNATTGGRAMGFIRDFRQAFRSLRKAPAFAFATVALIAVGVGAVTTIFSVVDHVLLRPLPYPQEHRLVYVQNGSHSGPFFHRLTELESVEAWAGAFTQRANISGDYDPREVRSTQVTEDFFQMFGARPERGRLFTEDDFLAPDVVVLSGEAWITQWGSDPDIVGRSITIDGTPRVVVGVLDPEFQPPEAVVGRDIELWAPVDWTAEMYQTTDFNVLSVAGLRAPGVDLEDVQIQMDRLMEDLASTDGNFRTREGEPGARPVVALSDETVDQVREGLGLLLGAVALLLLVACANVAHLFLARGLTRTREMAVRRAMGAGRGAITRHLLAESLVVGISGGFVGTGIAWSGLRAFQVLSPTTLPRAATVSLDSRVLLFAFGIATLTAVLFGLLPAVRSVGFGLTSHLTGGAGQTATGDRKINRLRNLLVAGEVALSLVLITGAGLLLRSFASVRALETGFRVDQVWTAPLSLTGLSTADDYRSLMDGIQESVEGVPRVSLTTYALTLPLEMVGGSRCCWGSRISVDGVDLAETRVSMHPVTEEYFELLELSHPVGRSWTDSEAASSPVPVVMSRPLALEAFGSVEAAIGRPIGISGDMTATIVGVTEDNRHYGLETEHGAALYLPIEHMAFPIPKSHLGFRVEPGAERGIERAVREAIWAVAPSLPVPIVRPLEGWMARATAQRRFQSALFGAFAAVGLLLAAGGLYGTLLFMARQRRREMGIRLALGATRGRIHYRLLRSGIGVTALGVVLGLGASLWASRLLESRVFGIEPSDPLTLFGASGLLLLTSAVASWIPARHAARTDPVDTLKAE